MDDYRRRVEGIHRAGVEIDPQQRAFGIGVFDAICVSVNDGTVSIRMAGDNVNFNELSQQMGQTAQAVEEPAPAS